MVKAGTEVFTSFDSRFEDPEAVVYEIFETMVRVSLWLKPSALYTAPRYLG